MPPRGSRPKTKSDYALELQKRQNIKQEYGVRRLESVSSLESRLDNVVFRMGFAMSRGAARQFVSHRHIFLNKKRVSIPSIKVKLGDKISLGGRIRVPENFKKHKPPAWLKVNKKSLSGEITGAPSRPEFEKN